MKINDITRCGLCSGCGLCEGVFGSNKVTLQLSEKGFLRPNSQDSLLSSETELLNSFCPGICIELSNSEARYDDHWGPVIESFSGRATDKNVCHRGSSGGVISALAIFLLECEVVEGVIQTRVIDEAPLDNVMVISRSKEDVLACAGSRYAPSAPLAKLSGVLEQNGPFVFIGKPCDVAALRALSKIDKRVDEKIRYMFAFFCAGIPSQNATKRILKKFGLSDTQVAKFRYRGDGWPGKTVAKTKNGEEFSMTYAESWGTILNRELQFRCKICPDGTGEFADVACADAWYGDESGYPNFDEAEGRSLILVRTTTGKSLLEDALKKGVVKVESLPISTIEKMQPYQYKRKSLILSRLLAMRIMGRAVPRYQNLHLTRAALGMSFKEQVRSFIGMLRRGRNSDE